MPAEPAYCHGECKTPGGKLVAVDLAVLHGVLHRVRLHGDFFFHPHGTETATLTAIAAVLEGAPADAPTAGLAARVRAVVAETAEVVLSEVGHALGPGPLTQNAAHAARVADLTVYVRQHHADHDLVALAELAAK